MYFYLMLKNSFFFILICLIISCYPKVIKAQNNTLTPVNSLKQPPFLKTGDTVAIVAPAGILKNRTAEIQNAKALLKSWGLHALVGKHVFNQAQHFAGTDAERCEDFQNALDNPKVSAIWCARGGYGSARILDRLDWSKFKLQPKWIIGYSDITALLSETYNLGFQSIHGMMCTSLQDNITSIPETVSSLKNALFGNTLSYTLRASAYNKTGEASGLLIGGNLTILHTMLGSKTSLNTSGSILFIEEIGEYKYHIDRMLRSLKRAGYFETCNGVIIGDMTKIKKNSTVWGTSIEQLILDVLSEYSFPIAFRMKAGHEKDNRAMIFGKTITLKVDKTKSTFQ